MSDLVRNPEDRFSHVVAHYMVDMPSDNNQKTKENILMAFQF